MTIPNGKTPEGEPRGARDVAETSTPSGSKALDSSTSGHDPRPIGVFDSGVGGLTVASALMRHLPDESILYLGDTARLPYGTKSTATVARYTHRNIDFLIERGVKAVVIACNTASAVLQDLPGTSTTEKEIPIWGVIDPGAAAAVSAAQGRPIGVLATESTIGSDAYGAAIRRLDADASVIGQPCPLFVPLVEEGWHEDPITTAVTERYLKPVIRQDVGTLVLGCTHYPLLSNTIRRVAEKLSARPIALVDSAESAARRVEEQLLELGMAAPASSADGSARRPLHHLCVTDVADRFRRIAHDLLTHFHTFGGQDVDDVISLEWVEV